MKISVIIPCFNSSPTLERCLTSVVNQYYQPIEVIIVDGNSSDIEDLLEIVNQFKKLIPIKIINNEINHLGEFSRNLGIDEASGDYIAFLDSDDTWTPDRLESARIIVSNVNCSDFIIYGKYELKRGSGTDVLLPLRGIRESELVSEYVFAAGNNMQTSTFICPLSTAKRIKFDSDLTRHQDSDFMMRAQKHGVSFIFQNKKCANYFFNRDHMINRIRLGCINQEFCKRWLETKSEYFNTRSIAGYHISVYSRVLSLTGNKVGSFLMILKFIFKLGIVNFFDLVKCKFALL